MTPITPQRRRGFAFWRRGLALVAVLVLAALSPVAAAEDPEAKVYQQAYSEVKSAFDTTRATFDKAYGPIKEAQEALSEWRGAVRRAQQQGAIERIEGLVESGMTAARDEMVTQLLGEDALAALQKLEEITGAKIALPEPKQMLDLIRDPDDFAKKYGHMYKLSQLERAFRDSRAAKALAAAEAIFEKGGAYLDRAGQMVDFVALFDPNNNAADGPVGRLRAVGGVLDYMQDLTGEIPGLGHLIDYYADATEAFAGSLERLDAKLKEARSGSLCGQLGLLQAELAALDQYIVGGACALYLTDYALEAALPPIKVWEHFEHGETFFWRAADGASAYLTAADRGTLERAWRALAASRDAPNAGRASAERFLSRAIVTTRAGRIVSQAHCRAAADLIASDSLRETLLALGVIDGAGTLAAPGGALLRPGQMPAEEVMGLCLFDPSARNMILELAAQYRNVAPFRLELVSADWKRPEAPRDPLVVVNGTTLQPGVAGTRVDPASARIYGLRALADLGAPLAVQITAPGFLPKTVQLPLSRARAYAKIGLTPEPDDRAAAEAARAEAEARAKAAQQALDKAKQAQDKARAEAEARAEEAQRQEAQAEDLAAKAAKAATGRPADPAAPPPDPIRVPPPPDPVWVATGRPADPSAKIASEPGPDADTAEAGDVPAADPPVPPSLTPDPDVAVGRAPGDTQDLGDVQDQPGTTPDPTPDPTGPADPGAGAADPPGPGGTPAPDPAPDPAPAPDLESPPAATDSTGEAAPGMGTQVPLSGLPGQVWLGEQIVVSAQWTEAAEGCDPATPSADCRPGAEGGGASVHISTADDTEDIAPPGPAPAATHFIWQGSDGVRFDPPTSTVPQTAARFERPGPARVWAQIVRDGKTVAEGRQVEVQVGLPSIALSYDPPSGAPPGSEVTARIVTTPALAEDLFTVRWQAPPSSNREHLDGPGATIRVSGAASEVIAFEAALVTPFWGDEIGTITGSYAMSGGAITVTAEARGPAPQIWDPVRGGLVDAPAGRWLTGQQITLKAEFADPPKTDVRWDWTVNGGTAISNDLSQTPTVSRSDPGPIAAEVVARDRNDRELGRGTLSLSVSAQPPVQPQQKAAAAPVAAKAAAPPPVPQAAPPSVPPPVPQAAPPSVPPSVPTPAPAVSSAGPAPTPSPKVAPAQPVTVPPVAIPTPPSAPAPAPAPAPAQCAMGTADRARAAALWQAGLDRIARGVSAEGLQRLEQALALCPDAQRAAQLAALQDRLKVAPPAPVAAVPEACAPQGAAHARAATAWREGLAQIGSGQTEAGLTRLAESLAQCPNDLRAGQLAQLRAQLASAVPPQVPPAAQDAAAAARQACAQGGQRLAAVAAEVAAADRAVSDWNLVAAREALLRAQALCPDPGRAERIARIEAAMAETPLSPQPQPLPLPPVSVPPVFVPPVPAPAPPGLTARFGGTIALNGYGPMPGYVMALSLDGGQVSGRVSGVHDAVDMTLSFAGPLSGNGFALPVSGSLRDPTYGVVAVTGQIDGSLTADGMAGTWGARIDGEDMTGTWQARRE